MKSLLASCAIAFSTYSKIPMPQTNHTPHQITAKAPALESLRISSFLSREAWEASASMVSARPSRHAASLPNGCWWYTCASMLGRSPG